MTPVQAIDALIVETDRWRREHRAAHRWIEALACQIRLKVLREVREIVDPKEKT
jgi:hypothetical protein